MLIRGPKPKCWFCSKPSGFNDRGEVTRVDSLNAYMHSICSSHVLKHLSTKKCCGPWTCDMHLVRCSKCNAFIDTPGPPEQMRTPEEKSNFVHKATKKKVEQATTANSASDVKTKEQTMQDRYS